MFVREPRLWMMLLWSACRCFHEGFSFFCVGNNRSITHLSGASQAHAQADAEDAAKPSEGAKPGAKPASSMLQADGAQPAAKPASSMLQADHVAPLPRPNFAKNLSASAFPDQFTGNADADKLTPYLERTGWSSSYLETGWRSTASLETGWRRSTAYLLEADTRTGPPADTRARIIDGGGNNYSAQMLGSLVDEVVEEVPGGGMNLNYSSWSKRTPSSAYLEVDHSGDNEKTKNSRGPLLSSLGRKFTKPYLEEDLERR